MGKVKDAWLEPPEILDDWYYDMALWYCCTEPEEEDESIEISVSIDVD